MITQRRISVNDKDISDIAINVNHILKIDEKTRHASCLMFVRKSDIKTVNNYKNMMIKLKCSSPLTRLRCNAEQIIVLTYVSSRQTTKDNINLISNSNILYYFLGAMKTLSTL